MALYLHSHVDLHIVMIKQLKPGITSFYASEVRVRFSGHDDQGDSS
jgi:hypothetical protein